MKIINVVIIFFVVNCTYKYHKNHYVETQTGYFAYTNILHCLLIKKSEHSNDVISNNLISFIQEYNNSCIKSHWFMSKITKNNKHK